MNGTGGAVEDKDDLSSWQAAIRSTAPGAAGAVLLERRPSLADTDDESEICRHADAVLDSVNTRQAITSHQAARMQMDLDWLTRRYPGPPEQLATEVAMALGVAEATAGKYLDDSGSIRRLPATFAALDAGQITAFRASVIRLHTEHITQGVARAVEQRVLPAAGRLTMPELREACTRAVLRIDPDGAEDRHEGQSRAGHVAAASGRGDGDPACGCSFFRLGRHPASSEALSRLMATR